MSQSPQITPVALSADPKLKDMLDQFGRQLLLSMNCHALATIQSFDSTQQSVKATVNYQKTVFVSPGPGQLPVAQAVSYPVIVGCPVYFPQGGDCALTFPVSAGDQALIAFNDRDMDNYIATGNTGQSATLRAHSFSDAIAFVGVRSFANAFSNFDMAHALLSWGATQVGVSSTQVRIANSGDGTLGTILGSLMAQISDILTAVEAINAAVGTLLGGTPPVTPATLTAIGTALTSINTKIGGLLE